MVRLKKYVLYLNIYSQYTRVHVVNYMDLQEEIDHWCLLFRNMTNLIRCHMIDLCYFEIKLFSDRHKSGLDR